MMKKILVALIMMVFILPQAALAENLRILAAETPAARAAMGDKAYAYYETHYRREALLHELEAFIL